MEPDTEEEPDTPERRMDKPLRPSGPSIPIKRVALRQCRQAPLFERHFTDGKADPAHRTVVVEISDGGQSGYGEFIPTSLIYPRGTNGCSTLDEWTELRAAAKNLLEKDASLLDELIPEPLKTRDGAGLVDALESALLDLAGKVLGQPACSLMGKQNRKAIWGMPVLHADTSENTIDRARGLYNEYGYRFFKLKPLGDVNADNQTLSGIRRQVHPEIRFFIDPNYGLRMTPDQVIGYLNILAENGLSVCEDPIDAELATYKYIQDRTSVAIMLDEKVRSLEAVRQIAEAQCAKYINIHANWAGGFAQALEKARVAQAADMKVIIGSSAYTGIANAYYQTLASLLPGDEPCEQVIAETYVHSPAAKGYQTKGGSIHIPQDPGFGLLIDSERLTQSTIESERIES